MSNTELLSFCNGILERNLDNCRTALMQVVFHDEPTERVLQTPRETLSILGEEAKRLKISFGLIGDIFRTKTLEYLDAKSEARRSNVSNQPDHHVATRTIANVYASCHAYATAIVRTLNARLQRVTAKPLPADVERKRA